jgi:hypothetical protein
MSAVCRPEVACQCNPVYGAAQPGKMNLNRDFLGYVGGRSDFALSNMDQFFCGGEPMALTAKLAACKISRFHEGGLGCAGAAFMFVRNWF